MAIGFKVDPTIKSLSFVMEIFDPCWGTRYGNFLCKIGKNRLYQYFSQVRCRIPVCVSGLNNTNFNLDSCSFDKIHDKHGRQTRNFIPIKKTDKTICINIIIHQSVCITIKTTPTFQRGKNRSRGKLLLSLDIIRSTLHQHLQTQEDKPDNSISLDYECHY